MNNPSPQQLIRNAYEAMERGNWTLALERWHTVLKDVDCRDQPQWHVGRAHTLIKLRRYDEALQLLEALGEHHPKLPLRHAEMATLAFDREDWELAAQRWEACISNYSADIQQGWLHQYAESLKRLERTDAAEQVLLRLIREFPQYPPGHASLARLAQERGDWALAAERWKVCLQLPGGDTNPAWQNAYIQTLVRSDRLEDAARIIESQGRRHPQACFVRTRLAELAFQQEEWDLAAQRWESCIRDFVEELQPLWLHSLAECLNKLQRTDAAEQVLLRLVSEFPKYPGGHSSLARMAQKKNDWVLAAEHWKACLQVSGGDVNPVWQNAYAYALLKKGKLAKAARLLESLIQRYPENADINAKWAFLAQRQEDWPLAVQRWSDCIRRFDDGSHPEWHKQLATSLMEVSRFTEAVNILEGLEKDSPSDVHCLILLAKVHYLDQDYDKCLHHAKRLTEAHPNLDSGFIWAEKALIRLGRFKEAADFYSRMPGKPSLPRNPDSFPDHFPPQLVLPPIPGNGNDYSFIEQRREAFLENGETVHLPVSIIIPVYNRARLLAHTLAALVRQTYPRHLMEVVVGDDGSSDGLATVLDKYRKLLNLKCVNQEDQGFRAGAVRNLAVRAAKHPFLIFLDSDVIAPPGLVEGYMQYFHVSDQAILMGLRDFVSSEGFNDDEILEDPEVVKHFPAPIKNIPHTSLQTNDRRIFDRREPILFKTDSLKNAIFPFRYVASCNMAMPKFAFTQAGGFDERFQAWGGEDTELAYRLSTYGYYLIPVAEAHAVHQEADPDRGEDQADREQDRIITMPLLIQTHPMSPKRDHFGGAVYEVPKVSIYIPAYNAARFIREAVDSALAQTFTDLEVVICDDGSSDDTLLIIETHFSNNPRVRWFSQPHSGISTATNKAIMECRGMYIGQLDADDILEPTAVAAMVDLLDNNNVGYAYGRQVQIDQAGKPFREPAAHSFSREYLLTDMICTHFRMYRKRDWYRTAGCDESLENAEDYDLALKFSEICHIGHLPQITYRYRIHGANTSAVNRELIEKNRCLAVNKALSRMGLAYAWRAVPGPQTQLRQIRFQRLQHHVKPASAQNFESHASQERWATGFLAGSGRSGTTWLMEIINFDQSQRVMFEPFRVEDVPLPEGWNTHQYLHPDNRMEAFLNTAKRILGGDIEQGWVDALNSADIGHRWFIKDIRANLLLKWLQVNFPSIPYIILLRHPCAVARSRCRTTWTWAQPQETFLHQADLMDEHLSEFASLMQSVRDPFDSKVVSWCVENLIPLRQFAPGELLVVFYEHLCLYPEREIKRIFKWLGRSFTPNAVSACSKPSALCRPDSAILNGADLVDHWRTEVDTTQIRRAMEICNHFGLDKLYGEESLPLVDSEQVLGLFS